MKAIMETPLGIPEWVVLAGAALVGLGVSAHILVSIWTAARGPEDDS